MAETAQDPRLIAALAGANPQAYADMLVKQRQLARQQQLAQALMQQTITPSQNEVVDGRVVKYGVGQGLTKLAQALVARDMNDRNDQTTSDLGQQQGALYSSAMAQQLQQLQGMFGGGQRLPAPASADGSPSAGQGQPTVVPPPTDPQSPAAGQQDPTSYGHISPDAFSGQPQQSPQPSPQALAQQLSTNPQPQPAQSAYGPGTLDPRQLVMGGAGLSMSPFFGDMGKEMVKQGIGSMLPTELARNNAYQGITPDEQRAITMAKAMKEGQVTFEPGKPFFNFLGGQSGFTPAVPPNAQPATQYNPFANGGAMGPVVPVQGAQQVAQGNAQANAGGEAAGKLPYTIVDAVDPATGTPYKTTFGAAVQPVSVGNATPDPQLAQVIARDAAANGITNPRINMNFAGGGIAKLGPYGGVPASGIQTGLPPSQSKSIEGDVEAGRKTLTDAQTFAQNAGMYREGLQKILQLAQSNPDAFGKGAEGYATFKAYLSQFGFDLSGAKTVQDEVAKISAQIAGGGRTDAELSNKLAALPGTEKTSDAVKAVIPDLIAQLDQGQTRAMVLQHAKDAAGGDNRAVNNAALQFDNLASPKIITQGKQLAQLSNAPGANVAGTPAHKALSDYISTVKQAPGAWERIMKLNGMGAF